MKTAGENDSTKAWHALKVDLTRDGSQGSGVVVTVTELSQLLSDRAPQAPGPDSVRTHPHAPRRHQSHQHDRIPRHSFPAALLPEGRSWPYRLVRCRSARRL